MKTEQEILDVSTEINKILEEKQFDTFDRFAVMHKLAYELNRQAAKYCEDEKK